MSGLLLFAGWLLWVIAYAAIRLGRQMRNSATVHAILSGAGCAAAGVGVCLLAWALTGIRLSLPESAGAVAGAGLLTLGLSLVVLPLWYYLPAIMAQPIDDLAAIERKNMGLQQEVDRLRRERNHWMGRAVRADLDRLRSEVTHSPWLESAEENC